MIREFDYQTCLILFKHHHGLRKSVLDWTDMSARELQMKRYSAFLTRLVNREINEHPRKWSPRNLAESLI